ncbi:DUF1963 domain-containing protein [Listeria costaricensis]|uniref:DUF1963 domain-containing protein n=1 Tax=Listeria costaricensis TaxID=2026604 RepID=UPI000C08BF2C|nr:DUF1963 domain-containing protein [Listeria costaricensis]
MTETEKIKQQLVKQTLILKTGGIRPTAELGESWIGAVKWAAKDETWPVGDDQELLTPLATIFLPDHPAVPKVVREMKLITIFWDTAAFTSGADKAWRDYFVIRSYPSVSKLEARNWQNENELDAFPLVLEERKEEFPVWDSNDIPFAVRESIVQLEEQQGLDYFEDIAGDYYAHAGHKIGGYPAYIQPGPCLPDSTAFVLQLSTDEKSGLWIVDNGSFYFYYDAVKQDWEVHCDFF